MTFNPIWESEFPILVEQHQLAFDMAIVALIIPCKIIVFTIHNWLTKRDYTYSLDDICDFGIATCVAIWIYLYDTWSKEPNPDYPEHTRFENFTNQMIIRNYSKEFRFLIFLAVMDVFMWIRFLLML